MTPTTMKSKSLLRALTLAIGLSSSIPTQASQGGVFGWMKNNWREYTFTAGAVLSSAALLRQVNIYNKKCLLHKTKFKKLNQNRIRVEKLQDLSGTACTITEENMPDLNVKCVHITRSLSALHPAKPAIKPKERDHFIQDLEQRSKNKHAEYQSDELEALESSVSPEPPATPIPAERSAFNRTLERRGQHTQTATSKTDSLTHPSITHSKKLSSNPTPCQEQELCTNWNKLVFAMGTTLVGIGLICTPRSQGSNWFKRHTKELGSMTLGIVAMLWLENDIQRINSSLKRIGELDGELERLSNESNETHDRADLIVGAQCHLRDKADSLIDILEERQRKLPVEKHIMRSASASSGSLTTTRFGSTRALSSFSASSASLSTASSSVDTRIVDPRTQPRRLLLGR